MKKRYFVQQSEASSSCRSDPLWGPTRPRKTKHANSDASGLTVLLHVDGIEVAAVGFPTLPSETSSRHLFLSSVDLSMFGAESSCDILNSPSSNASAPVLHGTGAEGKPQMLPVSEVLTCSGGGRRRFPHFAERRLREYDGNEIRFGTPTESRSANHSIPCHYFHRTEIRIQQALGFIDASIGINHPGCQVLRHGACDRSLSSTSIPHLSILIE